MSRALRLAGLPALGLALVGGVLAVQLGNGGGDFEPLKPADPCVTRPVSLQGSGIDAITEGLVLIGVDEAACRLGVSREALILQLAQTDEPTDEQVAALHDGLLAAVGQMRDTGLLPPASALVDEALASADLNGFLESAIKALPDSVVDDNLKTDDVLIRTIESLDLREVLGSLGDQQSLDALIEPAITQAVKDALQDRLKDLVPDMPSLPDLF